VNISGRLTRLPAIALASAGLGGAASSFDGTANAASSSQASPRRAAVTVQVSQTDSDRSLYLSAQPSLAFATRKPGQLQGTVVQVDDRTGYQHFEGIGAAMTDSSAWLIETKLSKFSRLRLMHDLFSRGGLHLDFMRIPIGASDFSAREVPYSYDDMPPGQTDPQLRNFSIAHDMAYILPSLLQATSFNPRLTFLANPWSAPGWMKANDNLDNIAGAGVLLPQYYGAFASYFVRFIEAYGRAGIPVTAIVPENEPGTQTIYPGMELPPANEANFINNNLEPSLAAAGLDTQIYGNDLSWDRADYVNKLLNDTHDLGGITWHCYQGNPAVMQLYSRVNQIMDECSNELPHFPASLIAIEAFRDGASVAAVWNIALDSHGGPVQPPNHACTGCIGIATVNPSTHNFRFTNRFFQLGQISHYVEAGATRIGTTSNDETSYVSSTRSFSPGLAEVAFKNPSGVRVLIVYNGSTAAIHYGIDWRNMALPEQRINPGETITFRWR
jgi:glucosylceramidase